VQVWQNTDVDEGGYCRLQRMGSRYHGDIMVGLARRAGRRMQASTGKQADETKQKARKGLARPMR